MTLEPSTLNRRRVIQLFDFLIIDRCIKSSEQGCKSPSFKGTSSSYKLQASRK